MTAHFAKPEQALATDLLHEVKLSAKRWFIAFIVMTIVEVITICVFIWYISNRTDTFTYYKQNGRQTSTINSELAQVIGGDYGESKAGKGGTQEKSSTK